ncbi:hypothetical protein [Inquilinus sp.]|jgi:hypothetical protein|uniref:hypothetical protein n=1 Tax=Inquilinus sp. TaxID=1932117 RepID=UPI0037847207
MTGRTAQQAQQWDRESFDRVRKEASAKLRHLYKQATKPAAAPKPLGVKAMVERLMPVIRQGIAKDVPLSDIAAQLNKAGVPVTAHYLRTLVRSAEPDPGQREVPAPAEPGPGRAEPASPDPEA